MKFYDKQTTMKETVQFKVFPQTSGYDFHFVWSEGEEKKAEILRQRCREFLNQNLAEKGFVVYDSTFDKPVGPWQSAMWFIEVCTVDRLHDLANPSASSPEKMQPLFELMHQTQAYLVQQMKALEMNGSLFIHANTLPHNSNMAYERLLHLEHSWLTGDLVSLTDIWGEKNGLVDQETWIKQRLQEGLEDQTIIDEFKIHFKGQKSEEALVSNAKMLLEGQHLLEGMDERPSNEMLSGL